jgi:iron complex outermembrane receptor protein
MKKYIICCLGLLFSAFTFAQELEATVEKDTTQLEEVILIGQRKLSNYRQEKTLSSVDEYLEKSNKITMIKRGNYAWEPALNNMASQRLVLTIDGMQIFGACTDKMDPITSYVDVSNLDQVSVDSGQEGTENGHCVGGGIDLQMPKSKFNGSGLKSSVDLGYETNGNYRIAGLDLEYVGDKFFANVDGIFRKSDNYDAGGHEEVLYSQFQKYNVSFQGGYKISENHVVDTNMIYDKATNVGYPALPMDVSLAEALIGSLSHTYSNDSTRIQSWETKLYFNTITHIMDDSQRPDVPIRMDMPGWSDTYGFYSKAILSQNKHNILVNLNGFYNRSLAEMTMYPNDSNQPAMFMYTWPDIGTFYTGIYAKDAYALDQSKTISGSVRFGFYENTIGEQVGLESLQIFYPDLTDSQDRFLMSFSADYEIKKENYSATFVAGYGERAPSVSEGYGFFLYNSADNYDYIGNPNLKNEKALEANVSANYYKNKFMIGFETSYFYLTDYIIGEVDPSLSAMTIGANGVKIYESLPHTNIFDVYLNSTYHISDAFSVNGTIGYNYGKGSNDEYLPFIKPFSYLAEINYSREFFNAAIQLIGNGNQTHYSSYYGETEKPSFAILNLNLGNVFYIKQNKIVFKYGIENILDTNYTTYADWNNIPQQGRNFYINASYVMF